MYLKMNSDYKKIIREKFPDARLVIPPKKLLNHVWDLVDKHKIEPTKVCIAGGIFWARRTTIKQEHMSYYRKLEKLKDLDVFVYDQSVAQVTVDGYEGLTINFDYCPYIAPYDFFDFYPSMIHMFYRSDDIFFPEELLQGKVVRDHGDRCKGTQSRRMLKYYLKGFPLEPVMSDIDECCPRCRQSNWFKMPYLNGSSTRSDNYNYISWNSNNNKG